MMRFSFLLLILHLVGSQSEKPSLYPVVIPPNVGLGDPLDLTCSVRRGTPPFEFKWFLEGKEILRDFSAYKITVNGQRRSVCSIESLSAAHIGNYTCRASNAFGSDETSLLVYAEVPPHWTQEPVDTTAAKGSSLVVDCAATGHPPPRIQWNRQKGPDVVRAESSWSTAPNGSLVFPRVEESDAGPYICEAHNGIGPGITKSVRISVHSPPELKDRFSRVTVRRGHTARLPCEIRGDPPLHVTWKKDQQQQALNIQFGTRFEVVRENTDHGLKSELLIQDSQKTDAGHYLCHAHNQFGEDQGKVKLIVQEPPPPPGGLRASEVQVRSIRLSWQPSSSDENGLVENYVVRYWRNDEKRGQLHQVSLPAVQTSVGLSGLHPGTSYSVQVFAQNDVGQGDPSQPLTFRTLEEAPDGAPLDLRVEAVSSKSIRVTWKPPQRHHWNGPLRGYYVGHRVPPGPFTYQTVEGADRRGGSLLLQGLQRGTSYAVAVKAFNAAGSGPPSHEQLVATLEEDPPNPPVVGVSDVTATSVSIHWNSGHPSSEASAVVQYLLEFREEGEEWERVHLPGERQSFHLPGLKGSTRYELRLAAYNLYGRGEFSPTLDFTTALAEISVPFSGTQGHTPFYFRPYFVIPVAASVVVIVTTVVIAWVCYKRMTLRQDRLLAACAPLMPRGVALTGNRPEYCDPVARPPSYTPPMGARHPVGVPDDDDAYDAPWDMANPSGGQPGNAQAGSYTRLKSQLPNPGGAIVIGHQSSSGR